MPRIATWRGKPNATTYYEAVKVFKLSNLSKRDVFYDLGSGHGRVCIWAARRCKLSRGIESHARLAAKGEDHVQKSGLMNVEIIRGDIQRIRFTDADVLYCVLELDLHDFRRWSRRKTKRKLRIVTLGPPPIPIKPLAREGSFYLTKFPYSFAKSAEEWFLAVLGKSQGTLKDLDKRFKGKLSSEVLSTYRHDFRKYFERKL